MCINGLDYKNQRPPRRESLTESPNAISYVKLPTCNTTPTSVTNTEYESPVKPEETHTLDSFKDMKHWEWCL